MREVKSYINFFDENGNADVTFVNWINAELAKQSIAGYKPMMNQHVIEDKFFLSDNGVGFIRKASTKQIIMIGMPSC